MREHSGQTPPTLVAVEQHICKHTASLQASGDAGGDDGPAISKHFSIAQSHPRPRVIVILISSHTCAVMLDTPYARS